MDIQNVKMVLDAYCKSDKILEIRLLNTNRGTVSGYFNSAEDLWNAIQPFAKDFSVYFTLQIIKPELLARSYNKLTMYAKTTTKNEDVLAYDFLHLDADPKRVSGVQANEEEMQYGRDCIYDMMSFLTEEFGFPEAIVVFSGNGHTADYWLNGLENNIENQKLVNEVLKSLNLLFSNKNVDVDTTVGNPARIIKFPGARSMKGSNTVDRPHRDSKLISVPSEMKAVTVEQLKEIADIGGALNGLNS